MTVDHRHNVVLLGSGDTETGQGGSTIKEILRQSALGLIAVHVDVVICNNSRRRVPGFYEKVEQHNAEFGASVEVRTVNSFLYPATDDEAIKNGAQTLAEAQACADFMDETGAELFVQAGFMKRTVGALLDRDGLNFHPGPLENPRGIPGVDTKGLHGIEVQEEVLRRDYPYSAVTIHKVTADYDAGSIVDWVPVTVRPGDTAGLLFGRVQDVEKAFAPSVIHQYLESQSSLHAA